jgi:LCP family protein required for cell wall assembly
MTDSLEAVGDGLRPRRPWLAAVLSFLYPGLGQAYAGRPRLALILAIPVTLLIFVGVGLLTGAITGLRNNLFASDFLIAVLLINVVLLAWRAIAIADAGLVPWSQIHGHDRRTTLMVTAGLLVLAIGMHTYIGMVVVQFNETLGQVFSPIGGTIREPPAGGQGGGGGQPVNEPEFRWDGTERVNVLLVGTDAAPGRQTTLTDVILLISIDPVAHTAVMISVPRDTGYVPMPDTSLFADGLFPDKVNALYARSAEDPATWCPDLADQAAACGIRTLERSVGLYLGVPIHHYALVDMAGFAGMIDAMGGVDLCLPGKLVDPEFDGSLGNTQSNEPLVLPAGCHHYNGIDALAYARSRKGWIEMDDGSRVPQTDFDRSERQQKVLLAMRYELAEADTLLELPALLHAIGRTVTTDFPRDQAGDLASLLPLVAGQDIERVVLGYPDYVDLPTNPDVNYLLIPKRDAIREEMGRIFGAEELSGWYLATEDAVPTDANSSAGVGTPP